MATPQPMPPSGVDYEKRWFVLLAVGMSIFLGTVDASIVNTALPTLVDELDTTFATVQWVLLVYLLTMSVLVLGLGRLGDIYGKKPIFTGGFAIFVVGSALAGISPSIGWLIGARVLQAVGGAMVFALGFAIITEAFPPRERGRALGLVGSIVSIGIALGPALGGQIIAIASWRWIFLVNLPIGAIGMFTAIRFVPRVEPPGGARFDYVGAGIFGSSLLSLMLGLTIAQERGFGDALVLVLYILAIIGLAAFLRLQRRMAEPMLDLKLFANRLLSVNLITGFVSFVSIAGLFILLPFYLQNILGYEIQTVGLMLAIPSVALGLVAPLAGTWSDRIGPRPVTIIGLGVLLVGYVLATFLSESTTIVGYAVVALVVGGGMGIFQSPNNSAIMGSAPPERLGITSGLLTITRLVGQLVGVAVLGTVWAARTVAVSGEVGSATDASASAQVAGLSFTMWVVAVLMAGSLALAVWGYVLERQGEPVGG